MKVKLNTQIFGTDEKPLLDASTKEPLTIRLVLTNAVLSDASGFHENGNMIPVSNAARVKRYDVWLKIKSAKGQEEVEITPEDATLLREAVLVFSTLIAGQARAALA